MLYTELWLTTAYVVQDRFKESKHIKQPKPSVLLSLFPLPSIFLPLFPEKIQKTL